MSGVLNFPDLNFYLDQASGEISNIEVKKVNIDRIFVVEADENNKGRIDVECLVTYSCDTVLDVPGTGYYDQRERCHVPPDRKWAGHEASESFMVEVDISWNPKKPSEVAVEDQRFKTRDVFIDLGEIMVTKP